MICEYVKKIIDIIVEIKCEYCGSMIQESAEKCPYCGCYEQRCKAGNNMIKAGQNVITQSLVISERDDTPHIFMVSSSSVPIFSM